MNDDNRPDPDALLAQMQMADAVSKSGRLFIFLGMCPGVGKTYAMLQTARQRVKEGVNVLVGIVETHGRSETAVLLEGMRLLPRKKLEYRDSPWRSLTSTPFYTSGPNWCWWTNSPTPTCPDRAMQNVARMCWS